MRKLYLLIGGMVLSLSYALAQNASNASHAWPVPNVPDLLFYIQRDPDVNTVVYTLNTDPSGSINAREPVKIYWIKYTEGGAHKPLNMLQKDLAYGLHVEQTTGNDFHLRAVAYPKLPMTLQKGSDERYHVRVTLSNKECILRRIFIRIVGGSHLHPDVAYLEFTGTDLRTGQPVTEKIFPN